MKITLIATGKTTDSYIREGISEYAARLNNYIRFTSVETGNIKNAGHLTPFQLKTLEGEAILKYAMLQDSLILLDEKGQGYSSVEFAAWLQQLMNQGRKSAAFVIGGAYGFSDKVYERAKVKISLSPMTFTHQMARLIFTEQLYRAFTIIRNEPYHHT